MEGVNETEFYWPCTKALERKDLFHLCPLVENCGCLVTSDGFCKILECRERGQRIFHKIFRNGDGDGKENGLTK